MAGKTKEAKKLDALDARVRALEAHNGWTTDEPTADADTERENEANDGDGTDPPADDEK
jgi:BMFP domain-containing protein YqiC